MTDETETTANLTTSAGLEGANNSTIVQNPETRTNEVVSPSPEPPAGATQSVETLDKIEAEVIAPVKAAVGEALVQPEAAFNDAKMHINSLYMLLSNAAGHASLDLKAVEDTLTNLAGSLGHLFKF